MLFKSTGIKALTAFGFVSMAIAVPVVERQNGCAPLIHFHLAGTGERGLGIVGNALNRALPQQVTGADVRAINYNTAAGFVATVASGAGLAQDAITQAASECPNAVFSLSGYSKGALVVHKTQLPADVQSRMIAVVNFGDPNERFGSKAVPLDNAACVSSFCNKGDPFCDGGANIFAHLAYARDGSANTASQNIAACFN